MEHEAHSQEEEKGNKDKGEKEEWALRDTGRYAHRRDYVMGLAKKVGLDVVDVQEMSPRMDQGKPIPGFLFVMRKHR